MENDFKEMNENITHVRLDIRELTTEVRNIKEMQVKVDEHSIAISKNEDSTKSAHKRIDKVDKIVFWVGTTIFLSWLGIISYILKGGV